MDQKELLRTLVIEASNDLRLTIDGLGQEQAQQRPAPHANPAGFIYFHVLRHWDRDVNTLCQGIDPADDLWHTAGFAEELNYDPTGIGLSALGTGIGFTDEEVDSAPKNMDALRRYHEALHEETAKYLDDVTTAELNEARTSRYSRENPYRPERWLRHMVAHTFMHIGNIQYVMGLTGTPDPTYPAAIEADG